MGAALLIVIGLISCEPQKETYRLTGDLYFPWLRIASFYGQPDSIYQFYQQRRQTMSEAQLLEEDSAGNGYLLMLERNKLLTSPFVYVKDQHGSVLTVFVDAKSYEAIKQHDYQSLVENKNKVQLKLSVSELTDGVYLAEEVHQISLTSGQTYPVEGEFRIESYQ